MLNNVVSEPLDVASTDFYRTIQSVYSELHGMQDIIGNSK
jgi:hypothetical protein